MCLDAMGRGVAHACEGERPSDAHHGDVLGSVQSGAQGACALPTTAAPCGGVSVCVARIGVRMARVQGVSEGQRLETTGVGGAATATMALAPRAVPVTPARSTTATPTPSPSTAGASGATHQGHGALAAVALAVEQANSAKAARGKGKRRRNVDAAADEAALRASVASLLAVLSSHSTGSKEFCEAVNVVKYVAYLGHEAKHLKDIESYLEVRACATAHMGADALTVMH